MDQKEDHPGDIYQIRLKEGLLRSAIDWFDHIAILPQANGETLLIGSFVDQPALRGLLNRLWDLNITILSVQRLEEENRDEERREK